MSIKARLVLFLLALAFIPEPSLSVGFTKFLSDFNGPVIAGVAKLWAIDSARELLYVSLVSWWLYGTALRLLWTIPARVFGLDAPEWGRAYRRLLPPWRLPYRAVMVPFRWWARQMRRATGANAGWETIPGVLARYGNFTPGKGIPFGAFVFAGIVWFETLAYRGKLGVNLIGKPGSGKSATLTTWLGSLARDASAFYIDVDGEITRVIGEWLERSGHKLHVIDLVNGLSDHPGASYNVFAEFADIERRDGRAAVVPAMKAAGDALVQQENQMQPTFDNGGRDFTVAVAALVYVWEAIPLEQKTLTTVRRLICEGLPTDPNNPKETPLDALLFRMREMTHTDDKCDGMLNALIAHGAATMESSQSRNAGNPFLSSAQRATSAWDLPGVIAATSRSDFTMADLKTGNAVVAIVCSVADMRKTYQPLMRLLVTMLEYRFSKMRRCRRTPAAVVIDEAQNLGELSICMTGPYMRKHEMQLVLGIQDLPGLEAVYNRRAQTIISNAGMNCFLPTSDEKTIQYVSRQMGMQTVREKVEGTAWYLRLILPRAAQIPDRYQQVERPLKNFEQGRDTLTPGHGRMIVLCEGRPFIAGVIEYWKVLPVWRYARSTYAESWGRTLSRIVIDAAKSALDGLERRAQAAGPSVSRTIERAMDWPSGASAVALPVGIFAGAVAAVLPAEMAKDEVDWWIGGAIFLAAALVLLICLLMTLCLPLAAAKEWTDSEEGQRQRHSYGREVIAVGAMLAGASIIGIAVQVIAYNVIVFTMPQALGHPQAGTPVLTTGNEALASFAGGEWFTGASYALATAVQGVAVLIGGAAGMMAGAYMLAAFGLLGGLTLYRAGLIAWPLAYATAPKIAAARRVLRENTLAAEPTIRKFASLVAGACSRAFRRPKSGA